MTESFAGFQFPLRIARLLPICVEGPVPPAIARHNARSKDRPGTLTQKAATHRYKVNTSYYATPTPGATKRGFYHENMGFPGLRWDWCDEADGAYTIRHTGWFTDDDGVGDTIRGIVFRLPHGRGFLAGWSMGDGMCGMLDTGKIYSESTEAAYGADRMAELAAEAERAYQAKQCDDEEGA